MVTSGDVPLLEVSTLEALIEAHVDGGYAVSVLSSIAEDPTGYGRIVRTDDDEFEAIVEHKEVPKESLMNRLLKKAEIERIEKARELQRQRNFIKKVE